MVNYYSYYYYYFQMRWYFNKNEYNCSRSNNTQGGFNKIIYNKCIVVSCYRNLDHFVTIQRNKCARLW